MAKKIISGLVVFSCMLCILLPIHATGNNLNNEMQITIPEEIVDYNLQQQIDDEIDRINATLSLKRGGDDQVAVAETVATKYADAYGLAGNQPAGGVRFESGGSFYWKDSGGPTVSISVGFSGVVVPISVSLGISTGATNKPGYVINVPDTINYYKLYVTKTMKVLKVNYYLVDTITGEKTYYSTGYPSELYRLSFTTEKV